MKEATALLKLGLFDGAYYLAGYAVECALKACIAKGTRRGDFPDRKKVESSHTHNLRELIRVAGIDEEFVDRVARDEISETIGMSFNPGLSRVDTAGILRNWHICCSGPSVTNDTELSHG